MPTHINITKKWKFLLVLVSFAISAGCASFERQNKPAALAQHSEPADGEAKILQSWHGDYPVAQLRLLPEDQREKPVGFINDAKTFGSVWKAFRRGEAVPKIDFKINLVLFARNTQFYNRIRIGKVNVANGVAEVLAMETMSAMPIEDKVGMSMVMVPRQGISRIKAGNEVIPVTNNQ